MEDIVALPKRKAYSSDLSAYEWQRLEPLVLAHVRRRSKWPLLELVNAILYVLKNGCLWRDVPGEFPPWAQSVKNAATATGETVGFDAGKLDKGRKRLVPIDTLGNVGASWVVPAGASDAATAIACWDAVAAQQPLLGQVQVVMGDSSFAGLFAEHLRQRYGLRFEKPTHIVLKKKNFCIHKKRWLVERTLAWLNANRRLSNRIRPIANSCKCLANMG